MSNTPYQPFNSQVVKVKPTMMHAPSTQQAIFNMGYGKMDQDEYMHTHEELRELHLFLSCHSLNEQFDNGQNERNYTKNCPLFTGKFHC